MSLGETIVKVIFWPRIRKARKIGAAAELIGEGRADETLRILEGMERRIPPYLGHLFFLTRARALDALGRVEEAEQAYLAAVFAKEGATVAYVHLAVLCGRLQRFDDARDWVRRIREDKEADQTLLDQADELEAMLEDVESGRRLVSLKERAKCFLEQHGLEGQGLEAAFEHLDQWIETHPDQAATDCDELACFIGDLAAAELHGEWSLSLAIDETTIAYERDGQRTLSPFELVRSRLDGEGTLLELYEAALAQGDRRAGVMHEPVEDNVERGAGNREPANDRSRSRS